MEAEDGSEKLQPIADAFRTILTHIGEDPTREGLLNTPLQAAKALAYFTQGYESTVEEVLRNAIFQDDESREMVLIRDIHFESIDEVTLVPFTGTAHLAYVPNGKTVSLSNLIRIVEVFARRLTLQDRLTNQIASTIWQVLQPQGVAVVLETKRIGSLSRDATAVTSAVLGVFQKDPRTRAEFFALIRPSRPY